MTSSLVGSEMCIRDSLITGVGIGAFQLQAVGGYPMIHPLKFAGKNFYSCLLYTSDAADELD
eukprot:8442749-Prorocentrum_lima.AAC.1